MVNCLSGKRSLPCLLAVSFGIPCPLRPKRATRGQAVPKKVARRIEAGKHQFWLFTVSITRKNILYRLYLAKVNAAASEPSDKK